MELCRKVESRRTDSGLLAQSNISPPGTQNVGHLLYRTRHLCTHIHTYIHIRMSLMCDKHFLITMPDFAGIRSYVIVSI